MTRLCRSRRSYFENLFATNIAIRGHFAGLSIDDDANIRSHLRLLGKICPAAGPESLCGDFGARELLLSQWCSLVRGRRTCENECDSDGESWWMCVDVCGFASLEPGIFRVLYKLPSAKNRLPFLETRFPSPVTARFAPLATLVPVCLVPSRSFKVLVSVHRQDSGIRVNAMMVEVVLSSFS